MKRDLTEQQKRFRRSALADGRECKECGWLIKKADELHKLRTEYIEIKPKQ